MDGIHLGGGVVLFENAITVPQFEILPHIDEMKERWRRENFEIVYDENGKAIHAINKGGFIYSMDAMNSAPVRVQGLSHPFFHSCEAAIYAKLLEYIEFFPALLQCLWWKSAGHVLCYESGASLGLHCDNDVNYRYGYIPDTEHATRNVVSALIYLNDSTDDNLVPYSFSGGKMDIPYFDIEITPQTGSILFMPANYLGAHVVKEVTRGVRYSYLSWFAQGDAAPAKGVSPKAWGSGNDVIDGQWWLETVIEDYKDSVMRRHAGDQSTINKLLHVQSRQHDHAKN
jgi:hypothetical protein